MKRIAILGCGHGGQALAAHLTLNGCDVALYADANHARALHAIQVTQEIELTGAVTGKANINLLTTDIKSAIQDREVIYLALPTAAHEATFSTMLPYLTKGQIVVTLASNFSSLAFRELQKRAFIDPQCIFVEMPSFPYACRAEQPGLVTIFAIKKSLALAALPAMHTQQMIEQLQPHFPTPLIANKNVLELGLNIVSGMCHPIIALLNSGRIGAGKDSFYFYREGVTPAIAKVLEKIDHDRCEIGRRLGCATLPLLEIMEAWYGIRYATIYDFFTNSPVHNAVPLCPPSLDTRYITQDIPYVLVPWANLGRLVNYPSTSMEAFIQLGSQLMEVDYAKEGRNLARMGLSGKSVEEVHRYINESSTASPLQQAA